MTMTNGIGSESGLAEATAEELRASLRGELIVSG